MMVDLPERFLNFRIVDKGSVILVENLEHVLWLANYFISLTLESRPAVHSKGCLRSDAMS